MSDTFKLSDIVSDKRKGCQQELTAFFYALFVEVRQFPHGAWDQVSYFFVITNTPFQLSGGGESMNNVDLWM
jgi:hypothetical protein